MVQRAEREPSMEEIVVALRETRRSADRIQPLTIAETPRAGRGVRGMVGSTDLVDLRDSEIERLLSENARLNARMISLLKVLEHEQANHAEITAGTAPAVTDQTAIYNEVRSALEEELRPALLVLLQLLQKQFLDASPDDGNAGGKVSLATSTGEPSDWIVELMHKLDAKAPAPHEKIAARSSMPQRPKLRQCLADLLNALGFESHTATPRQRFTSPEESL
jgi:hypothetical protein